MATLQYIYQLITMNKKLRIRRKTQKQANKKIKFSFQQCIICIDKYCNALIDGCQHQFCFQCIYKWSKKQNSCPTCRKEFTKIQSDTKIVKIEENRNGAEIQSTTNQRRPFQRPPQVSTLPMNFFYMPFQNTSFMTENSNHFFNYPSNQLWNQPMLMNQNTMWPHFNPFMANHNQFGNNFGYFPLNSFNNIQNYNNNIQTVQSIQNLQTAPLMGQIENNQNMINPIDQNLLIQNLNESAHLFQSHQQQQEQQ